MPLRLYEEAFPVSGRKIGVNGKNFHLLVIYSIDDGFWNFFHRLSNRINIIAGVHVWLTMTSSQGLFRAMLHQYQK